MHRTPHRTRRPVADITVCLVRSQHCGVAGVLAFRGSWGSVRLCGDRRLGWQVAEPKVIESVCVTDGTSLGHVTLMFLFFSSLVPPFLSHLSGGEWAIKGWQVIRWEHDRGRYALHCNASQKVHIFVRYSVERIPPEILYFTICTYIITYT